MGRTEARTSPLWLVFCWTIVLLPLGWGVVQSVVKSLPLFQLTDDAEDGRSTGPAPRSGG